MSIADASEASSAAPIYFDPKVIGNQVLIDGGVIANEPALYSYLHAIHNLNKSDNIRMVSIGTGIAKSSEIDPNNTDPLTWMT